MRSRPLYSVSSQGLESRAEDDDSRGCNDTATISSRDRDLVATGFDLGSRDKPSPNRSAVVPRDRDRLRDKLNGRPPLTWTSPTARQLVAEFSRRKRLIL